MHAKPGKIIITLLLFLVACSLLLAAFVNYAGYTRRSREEDAFRELEQSAAVGAQMMDTSLREMRGVTDTLATTLSRLEFADTDDMRGYLSRCALDNGLAWLIYQESGGDPVSSDGAVHDLPEEVTQWASGISSPYVDGAAGNAVVTFYQTVQQDGEALGRLYVASYAEDISRGFPLQVYGGVGYAYVVDGEGNWVLPVTYSGGHEINDNFIVQLTRDNAAADVEALRAAWKARTADTVRLRFAGERKIAAYAPVETSESWSVLCMVSEQQVFSRATPYLMGALGLCALTMFLMAMLVVYVMVLRHKSWKALRNIAYRDTLTGARNWRRMIIDMETQLDRHPERQYAVVMADIAHFRTLDMTYGYDAGNELLRLMAREMKKMLRRGEPFARLAADKFIMLMEYHQPDEIRCRTLLFTEKMRAIAAQKLADMPIELYYGVYCLTERDGEEIIQPHLMLEKADAAVRSIKRSRLTHAQEDISNIAFYQEAAAQDYEEAASLEAHMEEALKNGEFVIGYQPRIRLEDGRVVGAEAKIRWNHPERGMLMPEAFIPLFENNLFILKVDRFVFDTVVEQQRRWLEEGKKPVPLSMHLSPHQAYDEHLLQYMSQRLKDTGVPAFLIELELDPVLLQQNREKVLPFARKLYQRGFTLAAGGCGSGGFPLHLLRDLPVSVLKADRQFVQESTDSQRGEQLITGLADMARELHVKVVAEGVEDERQLEVVIRAGCDMAQGAHFGAYLTREEFETVLGQAQEENP